MAIEIDGQPAGSADLALYMRLISSVWSEHRLRPRLGGVEPVRRPVPVRRQAATRWSSNSCRHPTSKLAPAEAAAEMSRQ